MPTSPRLASFAALLVTVALLAVACAPPQPPAEPPRAAPRPAATAPSSPALTPAPSAKVIVPPPSPPRPPPPVVTAAMRGEPEGKSLSEVRLVASSCDDHAKLVRVQADVTVRAMREALTASLRRWTADQAGCWRQLREEARAREEQRYSGLNSFGIGSVGGLAMGSGSGRSAPPQVRMGAASMGSRPAAAKSASGTNNQVVGVDEADLVKTDGRYVYVAMNGALRIVEALNPRLVSTTKLPGKVTDLFLEGDRAVVYTSKGGRGKRCTYGYDCAFAGDGSSTTIVVLDVADRTAPRVVREIELSGSLMAARRIGTTVHTVVADGDSEAPPYQTWPAGLDTCGNTEAVVRAKFAALALENERHIRATMSFPTLRDRGVDQPLCDGLLKTAIADGQSFTTVASFDLADDKVKVATATLQSRPGAVFASADALYMSVTHARGRRGARWYSFYGGVDEVSDIHKFHLGAKPSDTRYLGSGVVPGHVLNQFAMDEWAGYLRVATTRGRVPNPDVESAVSILAEAQGGNLVRVGAITKIAPGEDIRAVRFDADRGYVVTFKKTDPLFVMDLYEPAKPAILGELKIPGFSTYMHRIDPDHLLSIGFDANDHGDFAYFDGVILQLFDVRVPTEPKLVHKEKIGTRGSSSEAATNHLAFNYFADRGLLAFPMTLCEGGGDGRNGTELAFSGLLVYDVSVEKGFTKLGGVDHGKHGESCSTWWSNATSSVKRSVFLDELVYSIATDRMKVQRLGHFGEDVASIALMP